MKSNPFTYLKPAFPEHPKLGSKSPEALTLPYIGVSIARIAPKQKGHDIARTNLKNNNNKIQKKSNSLALSQQPYRSFSCKRKTPQCLCHPAHFKKGHY
jgi:hypothetical protein